MYSPSQLPSIATKKHPPKQMVSTKSSSSSSKSVSKSQDIQKSSSAGPSTSRSPDRPVDVSTPKGRRQKGSASRKSSGILSVAAPFQSLIQSPHASTSQDPIITPGRVSVTKNYVWMPSESESEAEYIDGKKVTQKTCKLD